VIGGVPAAATPSGSAGASGVILAPVAYDRTRVPHITYSRTTSCSDARGSLGMARALRSPCRRDPSREKEFV